ncbi:hypothetical protein DFP72DRAFT_807213, partial [Ephemerocybe angulata]
MLAVAAKYNLRYAPPILTEEVRRSLPAWYHPGKRGTTNTQENGPIPQCLRDVHKIFTVGHLEAFVDEYPHPPVFPEPEQGANIAQVARGCQCEDCRDARTLGCKDPEVCYHRAVRDLNLLEDKWHPKAPQPTLDVLLESFRAATSGLALGDAEKLFNPRLDAYASLESGFRIFEPTA